MGNISSQEELLDKEEETGDWRQFFQNNDNVKFKGEEPNFEEEGWTRRRPKKK